MRKEPEEPEEEPEDPPKPKPKPKPKKKPKSPKPSDQKEPKPDEEEPAPEDEEPEEPEDPPKPKKPKNKQKAKPKSKPKQPEEEEPEEPEENPDEEPEEPEKPKPRSAKKPKKPKQPKPEEDEPEPEEEDKPEENDAEPDPEQLGPQPGQPVVTRIIYQKVPVPVIPRNCILPNNGPSGPISPSPFRPPQQPSRTFPSIFIPPRPQPTYTYRRVYEIPVRPGQPDPLAPYTRPQRMRQLMQDMIGGELEKFHTMMTKLREATNDEPEKNIMTNVLLGCSQFQNVIRANQLFDFKELTKGFDPSQSQPGPAPDQSSPPSRGGSPEGASDSNPIYSISRIIRVQRK